jgi:selenocysteine-specific elongation factor
LDVIIGTAGHIDHGKTTLVRALTGVDADRLPEEKRRGITIDIGFAELSLDGVRFGFVDVPGHERFVKNMLAGVHGIDLVALVIAADEGVMPQTREHFDICRLLGIETGLVVITKSDLVEPDLLELVQDEARELVAGSFLETAPIVAVSARTGTGLDLLRSALAAAAKQLPQRSNDQVTRLPIDRSFTMRGFGAVVTGTLVTGELAEGDELDLLPSGQRVRVRGLQVHGAKVEKAAAGQRTAVNLGGIESAKIERGMVLAPPGRLRPTQNIDAHVTVLSDAVRPLRTRMRVRVHLGAAEVLARVQVLEDANELPPGSSGFVQLRLESPVAAVSDERFILRSYSPSRTVGGGQILDPSPQRHRRRDFANIRSGLTELLSGDPVQRFVQFVAWSGDAGVARAELAARTSWRDAMLDRMAQAAVGSRLVVAAGGVFLPSEAFTSLTAAVLAAVTEHHRRAPLERGLPRETLREKLFAHGYPEVFRAVLDQLVAKGSLAADNDVVRAAGHSISLSVEDQTISDKLSAVYRDAGLEPPTIEEALARASATNQRQRARRLLQLLIDAGELSQITAEVFCNRGALDTLRVQLADYALRHEPDRLIDVPAFKELTGVSRKYAIPLLEFLDRIKVTRRAGDKRIILAK